MTTEQVTPIALEDIYAACEEATKYLRDLTDKDTAEIVSQNIVPKPPLPAKQDRQIGFDIDVRNIKLTVSCSG